MSRQRLTTKVAGEDVYTMNGARPEEDKRGGNGSGEAFNKAYNIGGPSDFAEDPISKAETAKLNTEDGKRNEMNIGELRLAFANAIKNSQDVREHASKCVTASECMLPGATEEVIAQNAADLMFMPDFAIDGVLSRMANLAEGAIDAAKPEDQKPEEKEAASAATEGALAPFAPAAEDKKPEDKKPEEKDASAEKSAMETKLAELQNAVAALTEQLSCMKGAGDPAPATAPEAAPAPAGDAGDVKTDLDDAATTDDLDKELAGVGDTAKTASVKGDALESIFAAYDPAPAMSSAMVRKASSNSADDELAAMWGSTPDVSSVFR